MKKYWLWLVPVALLAFILYRKKSGGAMSSQQGAAKNTATATRPDSIWGGWAQSGDQTLQNTTRYVNAAASAIAGLSSGYRSLFGGPATGSGGGAGVPTSYTQQDSPTDDPNNSLWSWA